MPDFRMSVSSLIQGEIDSFKRFVSDLIDEFYENDYDPRVSLDQGKIVGLIARVKNELDCIRYELTEDFK